MSTFFFKPEGNSATEAVNKLKDLLKKLQDQHAIENWKWDDADPESILAVETNNLSSEELKHQLRETGVDVDFAKASG